MDIVEGLLSFLGGALRVIGGLLDAADFFDLLGWWTLYLIPAPMWAVAAFMACGGWAHSTPSMTAAALAFAAGAALTVAWARKVETAGYILWGATAASLVLILVRAALA